MRIAPLASVPDDPWFLAGGGECGALLRGIDWVGHPLGPPERWTMSLRAGGKILSSKLPMLMAWGTKLSIAYNDACAPFLGARHPAAMSGPIAQAWSKGWDTIEPLVGVALGGEAVSKVELQLAIERDRKVADTWCVRRPAPHPAPVRAQVQHAAQCGGRARRGVSIFHDVLERPRRIAEANST